MAEGRKFDVRLDPDAIKEYDKLDNSILEVVNKQIDELEFRADEVGKILENNNTKLVGCREIKLKDAGLRIVYRITNKTVEVLRIVYILTIEKRSNDFVFKIADKRNKEFKHFKDKDLTKYLAGTLKWEEKKSSINMIKRKSKEKDDK